MTGLHIIFDGRNTAYRANVVTELYTKQGIRTSAILGTLNITHSTLEEMNKLYNLPIKEGIFVWDKGHSARRKEVYPEYKANRKKEWTPEDELWIKEFHYQTDALHSNLKLFGMKSYRKQGWEGDDLVFGFTEQLSKKNPNDISIIVSTDEDFHQLISSTVHVYSPIKKILYTPDNYKELAGIDVESFLAYKILKGDKSDGIPGIEGIGEKTAKTLVNKYGGLGKLLQHTEDLKKSKRTAKIVTEEGLEILDRNDKLINLKDYVDLAPVKDDIKDILNSTITVEPMKVYDFLMKYQLTSIVVKYKEWLTAFRDMVDNFSTDIIEETD